MEFKGIVKEIVDRAKLHKKKIVLPETSDLRVLKAASIICDENIADVILIGDVNKILDLCNSNDISLDLSKVKIINNLTSDKRQEYINFLYEIRKAKGLTLEQAEELINIDVYFGVMMVKLGEADGLVSGAVHTTAETLRPALQIVKQAECVRSVSTFFIMEVPNCKFGSEGRFVFSDCSLIEFPTEDQLCDIAIASANSFKNFIHNDEPRVAMLSYSTKGSAKDESIDKINRAIEKAKNMNIDFEIDGEMQLDAAIIEEVAKIKAPSSKVAGKANILVFPDVQSGNIGYKLVQRFGNAVALGPITQGLAKPVNDLSRGCSVEEIIGTVAITCIQAQSK